MAEDFDIELGYDYTPENLSELTGEDDLGFFHPYSDTVAVNSKFIIKQALRTINSLDLDKEQQKVYFQALSRETVVHELLHRTSAFQKDISSSLGSVVNTFEKEEEFDDLVASGWDEEHPMYGMVEGRIKTLYEYLNEGLTDTLALLAAFNESRDQVENQGQLFEVMFHSAYGPEKNFFITLLELTKQKLEKKENDSALTHHEVLKKFFLYYLNPKAHPLTITKEDFHLGSLLLEADESTNTMFSPSDERVGYIREVLMAGLPKRKVTEREVSVETELEESYDNEDLYEALEGAYDKNQVIDVKIEIAAIKQYKEIMYLVAMESPNIVHLLQYLDFKDEEIIDSLSSNLNITSNIIEDIAKITDLDTAMEIAESHLLSSKLVSHLESLQE